MKTPSSTTGCLASLVVAHNAPPFNGFDVQNHPSLGELRLFPSLTNIGSDECCVADPAGPIQGLPYAITRLQRRTPSGAVSRWGTLTGMLGSRAFPVSAQQASPSTPIKFVTCPLPRVTTYDITVLCQ
ncbi:hypothetical protein LX36DRAFT_296781 [Colletotrichum falcatum]|nr:hypothetical protein LX36DRAFT_296781 [Colletotrichum falcatum]